MSKLEQPQGNFKMNLNFRRTGNDKAPPITGTISTPEEPDQAFAFSAFAQIDEKGEPYWIGPVDTNRSMRQALNTQPERGTHFIAIRENGFKVFKDLRDGTPNPAYAKLSEEEQAHEDSKPAFWATWTRTADQPQIRASAWEREANRYGPWASGNTQYPMTKDEVAALKSGKPDPKTLNEPEYKPQPRRTSDNNDRQRA